MKAIKELIEEERSLQGKISELRSKLFNVKKEIEELELKDVRGKIFTNDRFERCRVVGLDGRYVIVKRLRNNGEEYNVNTRTAYTLERFLQESKEEGEQ